MRFQIKNITGDLTSKDPDLWVGRKLYATSGQLQQLLPIDAQETQFISAKALTELSLTYPKYFTILDADGSVDENVSRRAHYTGLTTAWQFIDLGKYVGSLSFTNPASSGVIQFSLSGGAGFGAAPATDTISDVLAKETITITAIMEPIRYIYIKGDGTAAEVYVLID